jgi:hypothetical protein
MAKPHHQKQQLAAALTDVRIQVQDEMSHLRHTLNLKQHILVDQNHLWEWTSCAPIFRWLLSGLPTRKKRIYIHSSSESPQKACRRAARPAWKEVWKIFKPLIAAYVAQLMADKPKRSESM